MRLSVKLKISDKKKINKSKRTTKRYKVNFMYLLYVTYLCIQCALVSQFFFRVTFDGQTEMKLVDLM